MFGFDIEKPSQLFHNYCEDFIALVFGSQG